MRVFPIKLRAHETPHYTSSPYDYREAFLAAFRAAKPGGTYYCFDVTILSRKEVEFIAYDMRDFLSGGIGEEIWRGRASVAAKLTLKDVESAVRDAAVERLMAERAAEADAIIARYADEIRADLDASAP